MGIGLVNNGNFPIFYIASVLTNIGKAFLSLLSKHFPRDHKFYKIFNKQTVKLSHSCCPNLGWIISPHNRKLLNCKEDAISQEQKCNCRKPELCPLSGHCLQSFVIYKATVSAAKMSRDILLGRLSKSSRSDTRIKKMRSRKKVQRQPQACQPSNGKS